MGDSTPAPGPADEFSAATTDIRHAEVQGKAAYSLPASESALAAQFRHQQYGNSHPHQHQQQHQYAFASQYDVTTQTQSPGRGQPGPYSISAMMHSLPHANFRPGQRFSPPAHGAGAQPMPHMSPYMGPSPMSPPPGPPYYMHQNGHIQSYYGPPPPAPQHQQQQQHPQQPQQQQQQHPQQSQQQQHQQHQHQQQQQHHHHHHHQHHQQQQHQPQHQHQHQQHQRQDGMPARANTTYYPQQVVHPQYYYHHGGQFANHAPMMQNPMASANYLQSGPQHSSARIAQKRTTDQSTTTKASQPPAQLEGVKPDSRPSVVRGPPRKPRQSGHAIWIGNLPPQTELMSLVYHVCKEAPGLESLFLISKSNCAFANYKDEPACLAAQQKIHDSKFQSVRLVSRLRKNTVEGASGITAPTGPSASTPQSLALQGKAGDGLASVPSVAAVTPDLDPSSEVAGAASGPLTSVEPTGSAAVTGNASQTQKDKYFILKSLTVEDLEQSIKTGIWATQPHNEKALNNAFQVAENVYLIFSANKSGEYFGYARMTSQINEDPAAAIEFGPKSQSVTDVGLPKAIPTEANEFTPKGSIMDDSERGTIFWEAEIDEDAEDEEYQPINFKSAGAETAEAKTWGKPFHLEWVSTSRLLFYRTRGLRNPWNSNKEIKIARDGTELEPSVGRKLTSLFSPRVQSPSVATAGSSTRQQQIRMASGYPPARPPYQK
ncbi:hypothetical protein RB595_009246 [Gaeumannomyces hyphopodioides]